MQKTLLTVITVLVLSSCFGQKTEFRIAFNSGLFAFSGKSAENTSFINSGKSASSGYTNNPYGSNNGLGYGLSGNLKRVTRNNFLLGVDLGYETVKSKVLLDAVSVYTGTSTTSYNATGETLLTYNFLTVYPYIGHRFMIKKLSIDIIGGVELGYCLKTHEAGKATAVNGTIYTTSVDRKTIKSDIRPRIQLSADYHRAGIYIGYSYGLANYKSGYVGGINECSARLIRFGLTYQIN